MPIQRIEVEPPYQLMSYHYDTQGLLSRILTIAEKKAPAARVGSLMAEPYPADTVAEWEENTPAVVGEECTQRMP